MDIAIGKFEPLKPIHKSFEVAQMEPSTFMEAPGYIGKKTDGSAFHVFTEHWKWVPLWQGEGLPPVGTVCEVLNSNLGNPEWERCNILYSGKHRIVYDSESCEERTAFIEDLSFRPIRTPEQIAAEERSKAIHAMEVIIKSMAIDEYNPASELEAAEALYDAGYRKFEIVDDKEEATHCFGLPISEIQKMAEG